MPLIEEMTRHTSQSGHNTARSVARYYVAPQEMLPGMKVVKPTRAELADLAAQYPAEFRGLAAQEGVDARPRVANINGRSSLAELRRKREGMEAWDPQQAAFFLAMEVEDAVEFIETCANPVLIKRLGLEEGRNQARPSVLEAVAERLGTGMPMPVVPEKPAKPAKGKTVREADLKPAPMYADET
jgi:hypothetical protein